MVSRAVWPWAAWRLSGRGATWQREVAAEGPGAHRWHRLSLSVYPPTLSTAYCQTTSRKVEEVVEEVEIPLRSEVETPLYRLRCRHKPT